MMLARIESRARNLLDLSALEAGHAGTGLKTLLLNKLLLDASEPYASRAEQKDVRFVLSPSPEPLYVRADPAVLAQALGNLLDNALKFTPPGGRIEVSLAARGDMARVAVEDTGPGLDDDDLPHLFRRIHRGRNASALPGSGLGLAIVRAIAHRHGGAVEAENAERALCLRYHAWPNRETKTMDEPQERTTTRILLIEDDPAVARSLQEALARERYQVMHRDTGQGGFAQALRSQPHLIILDVRLPDMSGFDVCKELRRQGLHQPVLMLTVRGEEVDKVLGLEMGADDYMTKPFGLRELLSRVRALLRRAYGAFAASNSGVTYVADLRIERNRGEVWRDDEPLALTPTEYRLLNFLVEHRGQVLSRLQLLEGVWGHDAVVENERAVNVYIRRLREKIERDPANPTLILTVPGIGYRFAR